MHIPDGLLSPQTYLPALALALPMWGLAIRRLKRDLGEEAMPRLAVFTALALVLSTLMLPLPGGTSGHAIGVALLALVFGPWVAFLAYSLVLVLQALVMGAGGLTSLPVNALAMGASGAFVTVWLHALLRRWWPTVAVLVAVFVSIVLSSALMAVVLGIQPLIAQRPDGSPLFFPFGLAVTLPVIVLPHVFIAAGEAVLTLWVVRHARKRHWVAA